MRNATAGHYGRSQAETQVGPICATARRASGAPARWSTPVRTSRRIRCASRVPTKSIHELLPPDSRSISTSVLTAARRCIGSATSGRSMSGSPWAVLRIRRSRRRQAQSGKKASTLGWVCLRAWAAGCNGASTLMGHPWLGLTTLTSLAADPEVVWAAFQCGRPTRTLNRPVAAVGATVIGWIGTSPASLAAGTSEPPADVGKLRRERYSVRRGAMISHKSGRNA